VVRAARKPLRVVETQEEETAAVTETTAAEILVEGMEDERVEEGAIEMVGMETEEDGMAALEIMEEETTVETVAEEGTMQVSALLQLLHQPFAVTPMPSVSQSEEGTGGNRLLRAEILA
jgi:hypothetical protein